MKLPIPSKDLQRDLKEFDIWITPSLGEINDTDKFKEELACIVKVFDELGIATQNFQDERHCQPEAIAETFAQIASGKSVKERSELFKALASTLFLVTGKSDNNSKCQFPLFLRDIARWDTLPSVSGRRNRISGGEVSLPRTIRSDDFMDLVAAIDNSADESMLLEKFISFLLMGEDAVRQFWSLGYSYFALKQFNRGYEKNLLSPIVIFKVRGSVSASGGHKPETILRKYLIDLGLIAGVDFNLNDIIIDGDRQSRQQKTRAYDFVLPYRTPNWSSDWNKRILMQSQFYAGDSGSVSHKNVDQTATSRSRVLQKFQDIRFVEYVDGAGYFSSLNGDLRKLLGMETTHSFIQLRSAPIRLRREFQALGFITPLEIEHAIVLSNGEESSVGQLLVQSGYAQSEVIRSIESAVSYGLINRIVSKLSLKDERRANVRQHLLLDFLALYGHDVGLNELGASAKILIPGYGAFFGMEMDALVERAVSNAGIFRDDISHSQTFTSDVKQLTQQGLVMMR